MKSTLSNILMIALLASALPSAAHAGGGSNEPTPAAKPSGAPASVTYRDPDAENDYAYLETKKLNGWFGTHFMSEISAEVGRRKRAMPGACGLALVKATARKAAHTVFSLVPGVSRLDHYLMDKVDPDMMGIASNFWDGDEKEYARAQWKGGAITLLQSKLMNDKDRYKQFNVAQITGDAAFMREISRKPACLQAYVRLERARAVEYRLKKNRDIRKANAAVDTQDRAQYDRNVRKVKRAESEEQLHWGRARGLASLTDASGAALIKPADSNE